jgi:hypothetical protein
MQIAGLVFMAATFYHNCLKEASEENIFFVVAAGRQQEWVVGNHCF